MGSSAAHGMTWPVALRLGRVSNLPTVWTNVLAGVVLAGASASASTVWVLMLALSVFYVGGMYLNDAFDADYDNLHRRGRPIPSDAITAATVFKIGFGLIGAGLVLLVVLGLGTREGTGLWAVGAGLSLGAAIVVYDVWHKNNPLGPLLMGLCRVLVYVTAAVAISRSPSHALWWDGLVALSYLIGLTYAAKQEDLRQPGHWWPLLFLAVPFVVFARAAMEGGASLMLYLLCLATVIVALVRMIRRKTPSLSPVVALLIAGISLLDGLFIAAQGQNGMALLTIPAFALTLVLQRQIAGT